MNFFAGEIALGTLSDLWNSLDFSAILSALMRLIAVFLCLTVHETCHGLAALALGTAYLNRTTYGRSLFLLPWYHDVRWQEIGESRRIKTGTRLKLDLILGAANVLSCVLVGLSGILLAVRGGTTAFYSSMNYTCRILTAASIGGWMNATRCSLPVGALLGSMSLVLILMLEVHLRISSSYVEYCLSAVLILLSAAWGSVQKKKRLQPKNRIT